MRFLAIAAVLAAIPLFATNLVVNGTFDNNCAGWTDVNLAYNSCSGGFGHPAPSAIVNDFPNVVPQISQSISGLVVGTTYQVSLDAASYYNGYNDPTVPGAGVGIDGQQFDFLVVNNQPWTTYTFQFTYGGGSNLLVLSSQRNGTDSDAAFDNVSINSVPEPLSIVTSLTGLLAVLSWRVRRRS